MRTIKNLLFLVILFTSQVVFGYDQSVTLKVGETKTISLPSEVTSKKIYAYNCSVDLPSYVELVGYTQSSVTVRGIKEYKYTVHVRFDFFYTEGSYNRSDTHMINIDVYEQGPGGGTPGAGDDSWGFPYIDYGCWGTITVERGKETTVYSQYNIPSGYEGKVKCYKWSGRNAYAFRITYKNWNTCTIEGYVEGYGQLYCYMEYGSTAYQAYYDVIVTEPKKTLVTSISLNSNSVNLLPGETEQLTASILPSNASDKTVTWASDNVNVATVESDGLVKGVGPGSATITCRAADGSGVSTTCKVNVEKIEPTSISLPSEMTVGIGETLTIPYTLEPENTSSSITWESSNTSIVTVSSSGEVTGVTEGTTTVTATTSNGKSASCKVTVKKRASWAGKYLVSGQHVEATSVTKVYPDSFGMTIEEKDGGTYITSMFGNDLTKWNEGGFKLEMNDDGTASVDLQTDGILDYVTSTGLLYVLYVWDDASNDWCDTWSLRLNEDGSISLGEFYVVAFTWNETDEMWEGDIETLYYNLLAVKDDGSAVHEIAQDQPGIHVRNGVIELDEAADVTVYKENGMIVYQGRTNRVDGLAKGMYIVCVGEQRKKVMIRK